MEAIRTRDPTKALFAPEVTLEYPLSPRKIVGRESVIEYVLALLPGFDDVKLERHMTGGDYVATLWEAQTVWGTVPILYGVPNCRWIDTRDPQLLGPKAGDATKMSTVAFDRTC